MNIETTGAGFVIFFDNRSSLIKEKTAEILYFILTDFRGKYDFPKGVIDDFENSFDCAIRETYEETKLKYNKNFQLYSKNKKVFSQGLVMYIGSYNLDFDDIHNSINLRKHIEILPNFKTGITEHSSFDWLTYDEAITNLPDYLKDVLNWAKLNIS